ncbi:hypothetical protein [Krasilnikovia sp. M28-CT-15]|uniref:hypothetical protein n=1 Tax=Krasilnikovia sp. M28-CT-15 TaxID=3373540 RepID=UPI003875C2DA
MPPSPSRYQFSYGFTTSRSTRLLLLTFGGLLGVPAAGCLGAIVGGGIGSVFDEPGPDGKVLIVIPIVLVAVLAGGMLAWIVINLRTVAMMGAWLEGTLLTVRERRSRTIDLARARSVSIQPSRIRWKTPPQAGVATSEQIPEVVVIGDEGEVRMRLSNAERVPLPPQELHVLAGALAGAQAPGAAQVAQHLQMLASGRAPA